jgi:AAA15 family ATPase/GTPase
VEDYGEIIEIKRLNFFIGKNNSGKSRFLRNLFISDYPSNFFRHIEILKNIKRLNKPNYRSAYLAKNPANGTISSHLDDYWASYQFVFFLGDIFGNEIDTTELVDVSASMQLLASDNMDKKIIESCPRKSYKKTKNGFLAFLNSNASVHGLSRPIEFERHTICISVHLYDEK